MQTDLGNSRCRRAHRDRGSVRDRTGEVRADRHGGFSAAASSGLGKTPHHARHRDLQLPFAVIPLVRFVSDKREMGAFVIPLWVKVLAWIVASVIVSLNAKLLPDTMND